MCLTIPTKSSSIRASAPALGLKVLPPDVNISNGGFTADNGKIRFGLNAVKNVGRNLIERVVEERKEKPYSSLYDFCKRMHGTELNRGPWNA